MHINIHGNEKILSVPLPQPHSLDSWMDKPHQPQKPSSAPCQGALLRIIAVLYSYVIIHVCVTPSYVHILWDYTCYYCCMASSPGTPALLNKCFFVSKHLALPSLKHCSYTCAIIVQMLILSTHGSHPILLLCTWAPSITMQAVKCATHANRKSNWLNLHICLWRYKGSHSHVSYIHARERG